MIDPIDFEILTRWRKCSIIDQGEGLFIFPGYEGQEKGSRRGSNNINEINIELN